MSALIKSINKIQEIRKGKDIQSAVIGGIAVGVWGEPRVTRDIDLKVLLSRDDSTRLLNIITPEYTALQSDPLQALTRTGILFIRCRPEDLIIYKLISTRLRDHEDAAGVIRRQGRKLDHRYVLGWLKRFESALDDSTLIDEFKRLR